MAGRLAVPQNDMPMNSAGRFTQSWSDFFQKLADLTATDRGTGDITSLQGQIADLKSGLDYLAGSVVRWEVGFVMQTAGPMSSDWLQCDGSMQLISDYPLLAPLLEASSGPATTAIGKFLLPSFPDWVGTSGATGAHTWIRAR